MSIQKLALLEIDEFFPLKQVAKTFDFSLTGASSRSCKYVLNTLMQVSLLYALVFNVLMLTTFSVSHCFIYLTF